MSVCAEMAPSLRPRPDATVVVIEEDRLAAAASSVVVSVVEASRVALAADGSESTSTSTSKLTCSVCEVLMAMGMAEPELLAAKAAMAVGTSCKEPISLAFSTVRSTVSVIASVVSDTSRRRRELEPAGLDAFAADTAQMEMALTGQMESATSSVSRASALALLAVLAATAVPKAKVSMARTTAGAAEGGAWVATALATASAN